MRHCKIADRLPLSGEDRSCSGHPGMTESDRACVKTHTSAKCGKHNSPARHRTSLVQYDLTPTDAIAQRYFHVWRDRWSFRTAKTHLCHSTINFAVMHNAAFLRRCGRL